MLRKLFLFLFLTGVFSVHAQRQDLRSWMNVELEGELFKYIDFSIAPELRLKDNCSKVDAVLTEIDLSAPLTKFFRLGVEYRYKMEFSAEGVPQNCNRGGIYIELDERLGDLRFDYRAMYLMEFTDIYTSEGGYIPVEKHRHKIRIRYRKKGWDITPGISAEGFFTVNPLWSRNQQKYRFTAGIQYRLTKDINIGLSYKLQFEYNQNDPLTAHILDVGLEYEL